MPDPNATVGPGQGGAEDGGGVALDDHHVGLVLGQIAVDGGDGAGRQSGERLVRPHEGQVDVGNDAKGLEDLIEHLAVLAGDADVGLELGGPAQGQHEGGQLDGFGAGAENEGDLLHCGISILGPGSRRGAEARRGAGSGSMREKIILTFI